MIWLVSDMLTLVNSDMLAKVNSYMLAIVNGDMLAIVNSDVLAIVNSDFASQNHLIPSSTTSKASTCSSLSIFGRHGFWLTFIGKLQGVLCVFMVRVALFWPFGFLLIIGVL